MAIQIAPSENADLLSSYYLSYRSLGNILSGAVIARYLALPGLVGFWPMSSVQRSTGNAYDLSGQGRTLTYNGNPTYNYDGVIPYIDLDGTGDYLSRADETDLDTLGTETIFNSAILGLTMGGWFYNTDPSVQANYIAKYLASTAARSFRLLSTSSVLRIQVSVDGTAITVLDGSTVPTNTWHFAAGKFVPSTSLEVFLNGEKTTNTVSIPASIYNSTTAFTIGGNTSGTNLLTGRASLCFLCATALSDDIIYGLYETSRHMFNV